MRIRQKPGIRPAFFLLALVTGFTSPASGQTTACTTPPPVDSAKTFLQNFLNSCYTIPVRQRQGDGTSSTDLDQSYGGFFFRVNPRYELILIGEYPRARYLSVTLDDSHFTTLTWLRDASIKPLTAAYANPFVPGIQYKEDQIYALTVQFGGRQPDPASIAPGCSLAGANIHANVMDATKRHAGFSWNGVSGLPPGFPPHDDAGPNKGGLLTVRQYMSQTDGGAVRLAAPVAIVRDLTTGCAVPVSKALAQTPAQLTPDHVVTWNGTIAANWIDSGQIQAHKAYRALKPLQCYSLPTASPVLWFRPDEYLELPNPDATYVMATIRQQSLDWLFANKGFLRFRFRLPAMPKTPCTGCVLSGSEPLRYFGISFFNDSQFTLASLGEFEFVRDPNGYVTLIVGVGAPPPAHVSAANYYTYLDLSAVPGYTKLLRLGLRYLIAAPGFGCSPAAVPINSSEDNSLGGFMGEYVPLVDLLPGSAIPPVATPAPHPNSCGIMPAETPANCNF
jgi:hypothetical protein